MPRVSPLLPLQRRPPPHHLPGRHKEPGASFTKPLPSLGAYPGRWSREHQAAPRVLINDCQPHVQEAEQRLDQRAGQLQ